jgi:pimeloyl-ACP methyl ester carboxylesterase
LSSSPEQNTVPSTIEQNLPSPPAVPAEERFVTIDGARVRYLQAGSGPPLILLHGLMGYSFSWRFTIPALSQHATVYALDQLGTGFSDRPTNLDCRLCAMADRFLKFLDAVGVSSFDLLGTSHGGAVAMTAAAQCQTRADLDLRKLILVAPVNPWSPHGRRLAPFLGSPFGSTLFLRTVNHMQWTFPYWLARLYGDSKRISPGTLEGYKAPVALPGSFEYGMSIVRHWTNDLRELESTIPKLAGIPTLLVWGSADPAVHAHSAQQLRRHFKRCQLVVYPGVGHLPYEEVPDEFNATLLEFLKRT